MTAAPRQTLRPGDEQGIALVMAMLVLTVLAVALSSVIYFTSTNARSSSYAKSAQIATTLAEAGINNGVAILSNPANAHDLLRPDLIPAQTSTYDGGSVTWNGTLDSSMVWTLHATSTAANPTGPSAAPIQKTMSAKVQVWQLPPGTLTVDVWNWIYSPNNSNAAVGSSACDTTADQQVTIAASLWVGGNLCLNNGANVQAPVYVGGAVYLKNPSSKIGRAGSPVSEAYILKGCQFMGNPLVAPCKSEPTTPSTNVWVKTPWNPTQVPADFATVKAPTVYWQDWYNDASPGPQHRCQTQSGMVPVFDNDGVMSSTGGSVPGVFNLTPDGSDYTCKTVNGELSWNHLTRQLTVAGVIFIDGSVTATTTSNKPVTYVGPGPCPPGASTYDLCHNNGQAVIYLSGTLSITGEHLCAAASGNDCDQNAWDPNTRLLIFATHSQGGQLAAGDGIEVTTSQTSFQGGLYADYRILTGQGAWTQGPLVSGTETVVLGQTNTIWFPKITIAPMQLPGLPPDKFLISPPYDFTG